MQTREDNIDIDKKKRNRLLSFSYWLKRFQSHYRGLAKRLICFSCSLVKSEFIGFENPSYGETRKKSPFPSPAPPFCRQHKEMGTGVLETLKHGSTHTHTPALPHLGAGTRGTSGLAALLPTPSSPVWGGRGPQGTEERV